MFSPLARRSLSALASTRSGASGSLASTRVSTRSVAKTSVRRFSDETHAEHVKTMDTWRKISYGCLPMLALLGVANVFIHLSHEHHEHEEEVPKFSYQKIRTKKYPWQCGDCALFDRQCHRECKAAMKE